jgi:hypothetical protein
MRFAREAGETIRVRRHASGEQSDVALLVVQGSMSASRCFRCSWPIAPRGSRGNGLAGAQWGRFNRAVQMWSGIWAGISTPAARIAVAFAGGAVSDRI